MSYSVATKKSMIHILFVSLIVLCNSQSDVTTPDQSPEDELLSKSSSSVLHERTFQTSFTSATTFSSYNVDTTTVTPAPSSASERATPLLALSSSAFSSHETSAPASALLHTSNDVSTSDDMSNTKAEMSTTLSVTLSNTHSSIKETALFESTSSAEGSVEVTTASDIVSGLLTTSSLYVESKLSTVMPTGQFSTISGTFSTSSSIELATAPSSLQSLPSLTTDMLQMSTDSTGPVESMKIPMTYTIGDSEVFTLTIGTSEMESEPLSAEAPTIMPSSFAVDTMSTVTASDILDLTITGIIQPSVNMGSSEMESETRMGSIDVIISSPPSPVPDTISAFTVSDLTEILEPSMTMSNSDTILAVSSTDTEPTMSDDFSSEYVTDMTTEASMEPSYIPESSPTILSESQITVETSMSSIDTSELLPPASVFPNMSVAVESSMISTLVLQPSTSSPVFPESSMTEDFFSSHTLVPIVLLSTDFSPEISTYSFMSSDLSGVLSGQTSEFSGLTTVPMQPESSSFSMFFSESSTLSSGTIESSNIQSQNTDSLSISDSLSSEMSGISNSLSTTFEITPVLVPTATLTADISRSDLSTPGIVTTISPTTAASSPESSGTATATQAVPSIEPAKTISTLPSSTIIPVGPTEAPPIKSPSTGGLSTGSKAAIGILVPLCVIGLLVGAFFIYRRYNLTHRSLKSFITSGVRYRTYTNASYKDDEVVLDGTWRSLSTP